MFKSFVAVALLSAMLGAPVEAQRARRGEQDAAFQATRQGVVLPLQVIEDRLVPKMGKDTQYIGAEFDEDDLRYRLKFMRGSAVIWVDVDGRSGKEIGRTGGK